MRDKQRVLLIRSSYIPNRMGKYVVPPLGILTLASYLRTHRKNEIEVQILDNGFERLPPDKCADKIKEFAPDVVGISALSIESAGLHRLASVVKRINPSVKVIAGGPHATTFYDFVLQDKNVDYVVAGEGEKTFIELLDYLRDDSTPPPDMSGLAQRVDEEITFGGVRPPIEDLDSLPMPAWDLIDLKGYSNFPKFTSMNTFLARTPYAPLFTSRACPYRCAYCHSIFGKKFRAQSPQRVLEEIELLHKRYGAKEFHIYDDIFNFDRGRVLEICEEIKRRGLDIKFAFPNGVRGDLMTKDVLQALIQAGAYSITYAVETASPRIQRLIHKNLDLDKVYQAVEWTYEFGAIPCGFFMLGFPSETLEEMKRTISYAVHSKMLRALFFSVVPVPRTELFEIAKRAYPDYDFSYELSPTMYYWAEKPFYNKVSSIDVETLTHKAWGDFYLKPWRMWNLLLRLPKNITFFDTIFNGVAYGWFALGRQEEKIEIEPYHYKQ